MASVACMVSIHGLARQFPGFTLGGIDLEIEQGEYFVLLGPTGSGKTVLVETLCGLGRPDGGTISIDGTDVTFADPAQRGIGYVPQDYALLPFKTVRENVAFGLQARKLSPAEINERVDEMLELLRISHLSGRRPAQLSGGETQRVALARALVIRPKLLVLDEPLSAIDEGSREELISEIHALHERLGTTTIHICHNLEEAMSLADRMGIIQAGKLVQTGRQEDVLARPRNPFVARFLRLPNVIAGEVSGDNGAAAFRAGNLELQRVNLPPGPAVAVLQPAELTVSKSRPEGRPDRVVIEAKVLPWPRAAFRAEMRLSGPPEITVFGCYSVDDWPPGSTAFVSCDPESVYVLPE